MKCVIALIAILIGFSDAQACRSTSPASFSSSSVKAKAISRIRSKRKPANMAPGFQAKFAAGSISPSPEAALGNLLLDVQASKSQIVISVPAQIQRSSYHPFGDGQSNAKMSLGADWKENAFQAIGTQTTSADGVVKRSYTFHPSLRVSKFNERPLTDGWIEVRPEGSRTAFYFSFVTGVLPVAKLVAEVPEKHRTFAGNRSAPDPVRIGKRGGIDRLLEMDLGPGYNKTPWPDDNVHGWFPDPLGAKTAIGGVQTWGIVSQEFGPFKHLYTCFDARDETKEQQLGVPSGAGWHHIGDAGETLLNTLSESALPVAIARTHGFKDAAGTLSEVITATWLRADEALVTRQGEFHWYLNPYATPVCTEIWVQPCVPNEKNSWGFNCSL